jgi:hypothetical protein
LLPLATGIVRLFSLTIKRGVGDGDGRRAGVGCCASAVADKAVKIKKSVPQLVL